MQTMNKAAILVNPPTHYRVLAWANGGATVRTAANQRSDMITRLRCGADWYGDPVVGTSQTITGFGQSNIWVQSLDQRYVWLGMLEKVRA